jgi:hypothetical protein
MSLFICILTILCYIFPSATIDYGNRYHERGLLGSVRVFEQRDMNDHLQQIIAIFLLGAVPRGVVAGGIS